MPEMDGLDAARALVAEHGDRRPRIVAMTADALHGDRERCLAAGMDDYVTKPIRVRELERALAAAAAAVGRARPSVEPALPTDEPRALRGDGELVLDATAFAEIRAFLGEEADEVIRGLVESFRRRAPETIVRMREAAGRGDAEPLVELAHALKGLGGTIGARRVEATCAALETHGRGGALDGAASLVDRLEDEVAELERALDGGAVIRFGEPRSP
jgi:HPt (histidine-containing phosphotransfer) domain-containing protein